MAFSVSLLPIVNQRLHVWLMSLIMSQWIKDSREEVHISGEDYASADKHLLFLFFLSDVLIARLDSFAGVVPTYTQTYLHKLYLHITRYL